MSVAVRAFGQQVTTHDAVQAANCFKLFASLPGAGAVLAPRLIVAFGTRRDRYQDAYEMQCYSGIAPVTESSPTGNCVLFGCTVIVAIFPPDANWSAGLE